MSPYGLVIPWETISFPRPRGDEPGRVTATAATEVFSPPTRG